MRIVHSEEHRKHFPQAELADGQFVTPYERPSRVEYVLRRLEEVGLDEIGPPDPFDPRPVEAVHAADYLAFLESAWTDWVASGAKGEMIAASYPARRMRQRCPEHIDGKLGYYALASETAITAGTWAAARASCAVAESAQRIVAAGAGAAFGLCRPPGHHAARDLFGGYCFLNNAAVAAQMFRDAGAKRVAVLDIDFHHGNGTQDIFYDRGDVFFCSLHGRPEDAFPYYSGYADETGAGAGEGATLNLPMPPGTAYGPWSEALESGLGAIARFGAEALVVSLGVDAYKADPISFFRLDSGDFHDCGRRIAGAGLPTVFLLEGGYAVEEIGVNVVNVLQGFEDS